MGLMIHFIDPVRNSGHEAAEAAARISCKATTERRILPSNSRLTML
jgi:hypothetical protein